MGQSRVEEARGGFGPWGIAPVPLPAHQIGTAGEARGRWCARAKIPMADDYVKFKNDLGLPEIGVGVKEFKSIGVRPP